MASATIIILPTIRIERMGECDVTPERSAAERAGVDLAHQQLLPSSDRRKVTELWRVKVEREQDQVCRRLRRERGEGGGGEHG